MKVNFTFLVALVLIAMAGNTSAQSVNNPPTNLPELADKTKTEIEGILGKSARKGSPYSPRNAPFKMDDSCTYKTEWGAISIHFYQETVIAFLVSFKQNKWPSTNSEALLLAGIDVNNQKPTITADKLDSFGLLTKIVAHWRGVFSEVMWEKVEVTATEAAGRHKVLIGGHHQKTKVRSILAILGKEE